MRKWFLLLLGVPLLFLDALEAGPLALASLVEALLSCGHRVVTNPYHEAEPAPREA